MLKEISKLVLKRIVKGMQIKTKMVCYLMSDKRLLYKKKMKENHERMERKGKSFIHCCGHVDYKK